MVNPQMKFAKHSLAVLCSVALNANASNVDVNHFLETAKKVQQHDAAAISSIIKEYKSLNARDRMYVYGIADLTDVESVIKETNAKAEQEGNTRADAPTKRWDAVKTEQQVRDAHLAAKKPQAIPDAIPTASPAGNAAPQTQPQATPVAHATPSVQVAPQLVPQATPFAKPSVKAVPQEIAQATPVLQLTPVTHASPTSPRQETPVALSDVDYAAKTIADVKANADYTDGTVEHKLAATALGKEAQRADAIVKANHKTPAIKQVPLPLLQATPVLKATPTVQAQPHLLPQATPELPATPVAILAPQVVPQATPFAKPSVQAVPAVQPQATPALHATPVAIVAPNEVPHAIPAVQQRMPDPVPNESIAHRDRYSMRPVHNPESLANAQRLAHNPLYSGTEIGQKASAVDENAVAHKLNQEAHHDERVAHQARYQSTPLLAQQEATQARANEATAHDNRGYAQAVAQSQEMAKLLADSDFNTTPAVLAKSLKAPVTEHVPYSEAAIGTNLVGAAGAPVTRPELNTHLQPLVDKNQAQDAEIAAKANSADLQKTQRELSNLQNVADEAHNTANTNRGDIATLKTDVKGVQSDISKKADQSELATVKSQLNNQVVAVESKLNLKAAQSALDVVKTTANKNQQDINDHKGLISANTNAAKTAQDKADQNGQTIANQVGLIASNASAANTAKTTADNAVKAVQKVQGEVNTLDGKVIANTTVLSGKVDTATYDAGEKTQNSAIGLKADTTAVTALKATVDSNTQALGGKADAAAVTTLKASVDNNTQLIQSTATTMKSDEHLISANAQGVTDNHDAIQVNKTAIDTNAQSIQANTTALTAKAEQATVEAVQKVAAANTTSIATAQQTEAKHFTALQTAVSQKVDTSTFTQRSTVVDQRFADAQQRIDEQKAEQQKTNKTLANHEGRIQKLEANTNQNFKDLDKKIDANRKNASRGIAGANALAGLPQLDHEQTFAVAAAAGGYDGEQAMAVGFSAHPFESKQVVMKAGVTGTNGGNIGWNVGTSIGW